MHKHEDLTHGAFFGADAAVEVDGAVLFGTGYEGGWHAARIVDSTATKDGEFYYSVELQERSPVNKLPQEAKGIPGEYVRPQRESECQFAAHHLKPGMIVEHMLPETPTCWWLAFIVDTDGHDGATIVGYPGKKGQTETANHEHRFRVARHWHFQFKSWVPPLQSSYTAGFQPSMEADYVELRKSRKRKGIALSAPQVYDPMDPPSVARGIGTLDLQPSTVDGVVHDHCGACERGRNSTAVASVARGAHEHATPASPDMPWEGIPKRRRSSTVCAVVRTKGGRVAGKAVQNEDKATLNQARQPPANIEHTAHDVQKDGSMPTAAAPVSGRKRKSLYASVPNGRQPTIGAKRNTERQTVDANHTSTREQEPVTTIKSEALINPHTASVLTAGECENARPAPEELPPMRSNSEADCINGQGALKQDEVLRQLEIRERVQAVRQKEIQTVQQQVNLFLPLISSEGIPQQEKLQLRKCLYATLAKAGLTDQGVVPDGS